MSGIQLLSCYKLPEGSLICRREPRVAGGIQDTAPSVVVGFVRDQGEFSAGFEMSLLSGNPECLQPALEQAHAALRSPCSSEEGGSCEAHVMMLFGWLAPVEWAGGCESVSISLAYLSVR